MRPLHQKIAGKSWLIISNSLRYFFGSVFLICLGFCIGVISGLYSQLAKINKDDIVVSILLGGIIIFAFVLWLLSFMAYKKRRKIEELNSLVEYLNDLKNRNVISEMDYLKEKETILKNLI